MIQRNSTIPSYSMIPNYLMINWKYMDFDNPKVYVDTSISDSLVDRVRFFSEKINFKKGLLIVKVLLT